MNRIQDKGMTLAISKCSFCLRTFNYLGFQVSREGVKPFARDLEAQVVEGAKAEGALGDSQCHTFVLDAIHD